jgi:nucleotide-binding universal stress UspA family protein
MYRIILVPLDGSELDECVLPHVEAMAKGCQVEKVLFVRVAEPFPQPSSSMTEYADTPQEQAKINAQVHEEAEKYLKGVVPRVHYNGIEVGWKVLSGRVAETLAEYAVKKDADLIVIATHGRSGITRWAWGSVADRILRSACVPVLMVRGPGCVPGI